MVEIWVFKGVGSIFTLKTTIPLIKKLEFSKYFHKKI
jgi:hypothetical protein